MKKFYTLLFVALSFGAKAQLNDDCATARSLTMNGNPISVPYADVQAGGPSTGALNNLFGTAEDDLWFKFTATKTIATVYVLGNEFYDAVIEVYKGSCNNLQFVNWGDFGVEQELDYAELTGLAVGTEYFVRVYDYFEASADYEGAFEIAVDDEDYCENDTDPFTLTYSYVNGELSAVPSGGVAPYTFDWYYVDPITEDEIIVSEQVYGAAVEGEIYLLAANDNSGCERVVMVIPGVTVLASAKVANDSDLKIFPNPAKDRVSISLVGSGEDVTVELLSVNGQVLSTEVVNGSKLSNHIMDVANIPAGVYTLKVTTAAGTTVQRLVIAK